MTNQFIDNSSEAQDAWNLCGTKHVKTFFDGGQAKVNLYIFNGQKYILKKYKKAGNHNRELSILKTLGYHENIIQLMLSVIPLDKINTESCIPLEYIRGTTLWEVIYTKKENLPEVLIEKYAYLMSQALDYCHSRGVVHRDIKAENVMITDNDSLKLIDFGMSDSKSVPPLSGLAGTTVYMAPEALRNENPGPPVDVWALGVLIFECFTKKLPFGNRNKNETGSNILSYNFTTPLTCIPQEPRAIVKRLLNPDPKKRISMKNLASSQWIIKIKSKIYLERQTKSVQEQPKNLAKLNEKLPVQSYQPKSTPYAFQNQKQLVLPKMEIPKKLEPGTTKRPMFRWNSIFTIWNDTTQKTLQKEINTEFLTTLIEK